MAKTKKMDESAFAKIVKEINAVGEVIRTRQDEKQAVIDEFANERKRFFSGKVSKKTLASSAQKSNKEFHKLDNEIRSTIAKTQDIADKAKRFVAGQSPKTFKASISGVSGGIKKKSSKKKPIKRNSKMKV